MKIFSSGVHLNYGTLPTQTPKPSLPAPAASPAASEAPASTVEVSPDLRRPFVPQDPPRQPLYPAAGGQTPTGTQKPVLISNPIASQLPATSAAPPIVSEPAAPKRPVLVSEPIFSPLPIDLSA